MLTISTVFLGLIGVTLSLDANVVVQCDNEFTAEVSTDDGTSFSSVGTGINWQLQYGITIPAVTADHILRVTCLDKHVIGGFLGSVSFAGQTYFTTNPIEAGNWVLESSTDGITTPLEYDKFATWSDPLPGQSWIWNQNRSPHTMVFRFDFGGSIAGTLCEDDDDCEGGLVCCGETGICISDSDDSPDSPSLPVTIVIDVGPGSTKAGFAGDATPKTVFPSIVGRSENGAVYVGDAAISQSKKELLILTSPKEFGYVTDIDDMKLIIEYAFRELGIPSKESTVLLTEAPLTPSLDREKMTRVMFETFGVDALSIVNEAQLILARGSGQGDRLIRRTGIITNCDATTCRVVPISRGYVIDDAVQTLDVAGRDLTDYLMKILGERGYTFEDREIVRDIKEKLAFVALDFDKAMERSETNPEDFEKSYELPDGQVITIGNERFRSPEALLQPSLVGLKEDGLHEQVFAGITNAKCDVDIRQYLYANIVLSGEATIFDGITARLEKEITQLASASGIDVKVQVVAPPERQYSVWIGGSIVAAKASDSYSYSRERESRGKLFVTREDYGTYGVGVINMITSERLPRTGSSGDSSRREDRVERAAYYDGRRDRSDSSDYLRYIGRSGYRAASEPVSVVNSEHNTVETPLNYAQYTLYTLLTLVVINTIAVAYCLYVGKNVSNKKDLKINADGYMTSKSLCNADEASDQTDLEEN